MILFRLIFIFLAVIIGNSSLLAQPNAKNEDFHIGDVVLSMLEPKEFKEKYEKDGSRWELLSGQSVDSNVSPYSFLKKVGYDQDKLPNAQGVFIRVLDTRRPETLPVGRYQKDQMVKHWHINIKDVGPEPNNKSGYAVGGGRNSDVHRSHAGIESGSGSPISGTETRPNNIAFYFYVMLKEKGQ